MPTIHPECWDAVMKVINDTQEKETNAHHRRMARGIEVLAKAMEVLRPDERSPAVKFDGLTSEEVLALPIREILPDWHHFFAWSFKVSTVGQLLELGWPPILAQEGIGRTTLWVFRDALHMAGLEWPHLTVDGHRHPARPKC